MTSVHSGSNHRSTTPQWIGWSRYWVCSDARSVNSCSHTWVHGASSHADGAPVAALTRLSRQAAIDEICPGIFSKSFSKRSIAPSGVWGATRISSARYTPFGPVARERPSVPENVLGAVKVLDGVMVKSGVNGTASGLPRRFVLELEVHDQISAVDDAGQCGGDEMTCCARRFRHRFNGVHRIGPAVRACAVGGKNHPCGVIHRPVPRRRRQRQPWCGLVPQ